MRDISLAIYIYIYAYIYTSYMRINIYKHISSVHRKSHINYNVKFSLKLSKSSSIRPQSNKLKLSFEIILFWNLLTIKKNILLKQNTGTET